MNKPKKVLLIGWDAADWKVIAPLMDAGRMPHTSSLVERGSMAQLATLNPPLSPMLWTSIATGKRPFRHGIHGFTEPTPDGRGVRPVTNLSRKCKAVWNILSQNDLRSIVIGWWPSHPAEPIHGVTVSDHFHRSNAPLDKEWRLLPGTVHPPELAGTLAELRLHPEDVAGEMAEFFVPRAREVDQDKDPRLASIARILSECVNIHCAATWLLEHEEWDFFAVYYDAIDHFCHGFMKYHPPRQSFIPEVDFELYRNVVSAAYEFHDRMLGTLLAMARAEAGDEVRVILMSDHGFHPDHLRPKGIPKIPAGPAIEHRDFGILAMAGPGIRKDELLHGPSVLDITPTVLTMFGLPVGEDMDGKVIAGAFEETPEVRSIPSWDDVPGNDGRHPPHTTLDPVAAREALEQMVALGYIEKPNENAEKAVADTVAELRYNLGEAYQDAGRHAEALEIFRELYNGDCDEQRFAVHLFVSCQALGRIEEMAAIVDDLDGRRRRLFEQAVQSVEELTATAKRRATQRKAQIAGPESAPDAANDVANGAAKQPLLTEDERKELARWRRLARFEPPVIDYLKAQVLTSNKLWGQALECLERVQEAHLVRPGLFVQTAALYIRMRMWEDAEETYRKALSVDPDNAHAHIGLCRTALHRKDFAAAASSALEGLRRVHHNPQGHFLLGVALTGMEDYRRAAAAFRVALSLNPNYPQAHLRLAWLLKRRLNQPGPAAEHFRMFRELRAGAGGPVSKKPEEAAKPAAAQVQAVCLDLPPIDGEAVVVSGLPRSGTSMIMQMLVAGGMTALTDGVRAADEDNPRGYFEFEPIRRTTAQTDWLDRATGKAVKIVAPLIPLLPESLACRVMLIERDLDEILASQGEMLVRRGKAADDSRERRARLKDEYARMLLRVKNLLAARPNTHLLCLDRDLVLRTPLDAASAINRFLGGGMNEPAMAAEVQPSLHRQRRGGRSPLPC